MCSLHSIDPQLLSLPVGYCRLINRLPAPLLTVGNREARFWLLRTTTSTLPQFFLFWFNLFQLVQLLVVCSTYGHFALIRLVVFLWLVAVPWIFETLYRPPNSLLTRGRTSCVQARRLFFYSFSLLLLSSFYSLATTASTAFTLWQSFVDAVSQLENKHTSVARLS